MPQFYCLLVCLYFKFTIVYTAKVSFKGEGKIGLHWKERQFVVRKFFETMSKASSVNKREAEMMMDYQEGR